MAIACYTITDYLAGAALLCLSKSDNMFDPKMPGGFGSFGPQSVQALMLAVPRWSSSKRCMIINSPGSQHDVL